MKVKLYPFLLTLMGSLFALSTQAAPMEGLREFIPQGSGSPPVQEALDDQTPEENNDSIYYKILIVQNSSYKKESDVEGTGCDERNNSYFFAAVGTPTIQRSLVSVEKCQKRPWWKRDICKLMNLDDIPIEKSVTVNSNATIFKSNKDQSQAVCELHYKLFQATGVYELGTSQFSYHIKSLSEIPIQLNSVD